MDKVKLFFKKHSPEVLTGLGIVGLVGTATLAAISGYKARQIVEGRELLKERALSRKEIMRETWKCYIPPMAVGTLSAICIFGSNRLSTRKTEAMTAAYITATTAFKEFKEAAKTELGETKLQKLKERVTKEKIDKNPPNESNVVIVGDGNVLCMDEWTGRYFKSNIEKVKRVVNDLNYEILNSVGLSYVTLNRFYAELGLEPISQGDELGWVPECPINVSYRSALTPDGEPCLTIDFNDGPVSIENFYR